jgi:hypothetical protein
MAKSHRRGWTHNTSRRVAAAPQPPSRCGLEAKAAFGRAPDTSPAASATDPQRTCVERFRRRHSAGSAVGRKLSVAEVSLDAWFRLDPGS